MLGIASAGSPLTRGLLSVCLLVCACALNMRNAGASNALEVASGCDAPLSIESGRHFFVDPEHGDKENDGSEARPWRTLAEVLDPTNHLIATQSYGRTAQGLGPLQPVNPSGPIKEGDTIVLMSGDHGDVSLDQYVNNGFISIVAGKDQTPVVRSMFMRASSHWLIRGVKFQGFRTDRTQKARALAGVVNHQWLGPSDNIVFFDNSFSTEDETEAWSPEDWVQKPYEPGLFSAARCTTVSDNHFFNLRDAVQVFADHSLIQGNLIEEIGNDGIDIVGSDLVVRGNRIRNSRHTPVEPLHADGIQGWTLNGATNRNVVIEANRIINLNPTLDNYLQGISIFDGKWDGLTVLNNVVINNAYHAISLWGVTNAIVENNTIVQSRADRNSWLMIHNAKDKTPSEHVVVRNNIAPEYHVQGADIQFDHNLSERLVELQTQGSAVKVTRGPFGDHNNVQPDLIHSFADFDPAKGKLDPRLSSTSPAVKAGSADGAPSHDIDGRPRLSPIDIGAFAR